MALTPAIKARRPGSVPRRIWCNKRAFPTLLMATLALLAAGRAAAIDYTAIWNGSVSQAWSDNGNWVFDPADPTPPPGGPNNNPPNTFDVLIGWGTVELDVPATISCLTLSSGTLTGAATLTLEGDASSWSGGVMSGSGGTIVAGGGRLLLEDVGGTRQLERDLENAGTIDCQSSLALSGSLTMSNLATGVFNAGRELGVQWFHSYSGMHTFENAGTFNKRGSGPTYFGWDINNSGTIDVQEGELRFEGAVSNSGSISVSPGAYMSALMAPSVHQEGSSIASAGGVYLGHVAVEGATIWSGSGFTLDGDVSGAGDLTIAGDVNWRGYAGYTMSGSGKTIVAGGGRLLLEGFGGDMRQLERDLENAGTIDCRVSLELSGSATTRNLAGGVFNAGRDDYSDQRFYSYSGTHTFENAGTFNKTGSGMTYVGWNVVFSNSGSVDVQEGVLVFEDAMTNRGSISVSPGADIAFVSGAPSVHQEGSSIASAGGVYLGHVAVEGATIWSGSGFTLDGDVSGAGDLTIAGDVNWRGYAGYTMSGSGKTIVAGGGRLLLEGFGGDMRQLERDLENAGTIDCQVNLELSGSTTTSNLAGGVFNAGRDDYYVQQFSSYSGMHSFENAGTFNKTGSQPTYFGWNVVFSNSGTVDVQEGDLLFESPYTQTAGVTRLSGGVLFGPLLDIQAGELEGSGSIYGSVRCGGVIEPGQSTGELEVLYGSLTLLEAAGLVIELGGRTAGTTYDRLLVDETAELDGLLYVLFVNDFEDEVTDADSFEILWAGEISGAFANALDGERLYTMDGCGSFLVTYDDGPIQDVIRLTDYQPVPEPSTFVLLVSLGAAALFFACARRRWRRKA